MSAKEEVYLDNAGAPRPTSFLLRQILADLERSGLGNPHSGGASEAILTEARSLVLNHFGAPLEEYDCVFTSGSTAGLKLVGELFPFGERGHLIHPTSVHTSLLGIRGYSGRSLHFDSTLLYGSHDVLMMDGDSGCEQPELQFPSIESEEFHLFATSGECNFSGAKICLQETSQLFRKHRDGEHDASIYDTLVEQGGLSSELYEREEEKRSEATHEVQALPWMWLLDAAKLASTSPLCLRELPRGGRPDFVTVSFYKMFGYPTGLGALLVRKERGDLLRKRKRYYGGGTIHAVAATSSFTIPRELPHEFMEDGTAHFQGICALRHCFDELQLEGGMQTVAVKTASLCLAMESGMRALTHTSGRSLCEVYRHHSSSSPSQQSVEDKEDMKMEQRIAEQGPTLAFNLNWADGSPIGHHTVRRWANQPRAGPAITLRVGCFCNIGGCQEALGLSHEQIQANFASGRNCWSDDVDLVNGKRTGAVRVSLGRQSSDADVAAFLHFLKMHFLDRVAGEGDGEGESESEGAGHGQGALERVQKAFVCALEQDAGAGAGEGAPAGSPDKNRVENEAMENIKNIPSTTSTSTTITPLVTTSAGAGVGGAVLHSMYIYPIKSVGGLRVPRWLLHRHSGLLLDREWVVCDTRSGRAVTLKTCPQLCLLRTRLYWVPASATASASGVGVVIVVEAPLDHLSVNGLMTFTPSAAQAKPPPQFQQQQQQQQQQENNVPGKSKSNRSCGVPLVLPVRDEVARALLAQDCVPDVLPMEYMVVTQQQQRKKEEEEEEEILSVKVCTHQRKGVSATRDADNWFSDFLQLPCRLLRSPEQGSSLSAPPHEQPERQARSFANEAPLLMVNGASVRALRRLMQAQAQASSSSSRSSGSGSGGNTVDVLNFRPNLVLEGRPSYEEESWAGFEVHRRHSAPIPNTTTSAPAPVPGAGSSSSPLPPLPPLPPLLVRVDKPCARCSVININPKTGIMEGRALSTLASLSLGHGPPGAKTSIGAGGGAGAGGGGGAGGANNCFGLFVSVYVLPGGEEGGEERGRDRDEELGKLVQVLEEGSRVDVT